MSFIMGECTGMFELLDIIKTEAIKAGWELKKESVIPFDKIYNTDSFLLSSTSMVDGLPASTGRGYFVNLPRKAVAKSVLVEKLANGGSISIYGILEDNTEVLIQSDITANKDLSNTVAYNRYRIDSTQNAGEVNLKFDSKLTLEKELYLYSAGSNGLENIFVNFKVNLYPSDYTNLTGSVALGYSNLVSFENQQGFLSATLAGLDNKIEYFLNIDKNRVILCIKVHNSDDTLQKNPTYQIGHFGKIRIHGGEWALNSTFCVFGGSYETKIRFSAISKGTIETPKLLHNGVTTTPETNIKGWSAKNLNISPYPNGELFCSPIYLYKGNRYPITVHINSDGELYGEIDGLVKIVATSGINSKDTLNLGGDEYVVLQDGVNTDAYSLYALKKG